MSLRIYLTGGITMELDGQTVLTERALRDRQSRLAFAYLVCGRSGPVPRLELAGLLWPGKAPRAWEAALSAITSRIRTTMSALPVPATLESGRGRGYQLRLPAHAWVHVEAAASFIDLAEGALRSGDAGRAFGPATVALNIARRPFLPGEEGAWVKAERARLRRHLQRALDCIARIWLMTGEPQLAIEAAIDALALDRYRETSHRLLVEAHAAAGNRPQALRVHHDLRRLLSEELGADPFAETERLYTRLLG
jgi:DNA-binding SARP family transcriptional activator